MKDYEKLYKEALERARKLYNEAKANEYTSDMEDYEAIFPELKESEDERIRKSLITFFQRFLYEYFDGLSSSTTEVIAWLEKQGEQKPFDYENFNIQQKDFAPKEEPKFKVGDWITNSIEIVQVTGYDIDYGYQVDYKGNLQHRDTDIVEKEYHLWTIQDAKEGDVLVVPPVKG